MRRKAKAFGCLVISMMCFMKSISLWNGMRHGSSQGAKTTVRRQWSDLRPKNSTMSPEQYAIERLHSLLPTFEERMCSSVTASNTRQWIANDLAINLGGVSKHKLVEVLLRTSRVNGIVVDVGAKNGGVAAVPAADHGREVWALEPDSRSFEKLQANIQNKGRKVNALQIAAGDKNAPRNLRMFTNADFSCFTCTDPNSKDMKEIEVDVKTLDTVISRRVFLLKSDTQGFEIEVMNGATTLFDKMGVSYVLVEFDPLLLGGKERALSLVSFFLSRKYECFDLRWRKKFAGGKNHYGVRLNASNGPPFVEALLAESAYTDLLCFKCT